MVDINESSVKVEVEEVKASGAHFTVRRKVKGKDKIVGRATLYFLFNHLHGGPFGFLEDVFVDEDFRGQGIFDALMKRVLMAAQEEKCYKIIATSRNDGTRNHVHEMYTRLDFREYGIEFRLDFES